MVERFVTAGFLVENCGQRRVFSESVALELTVWNVEQVDVDLFIITRFKILGDANDFVFFVDGDIAVDCQDSSLNDD